MNKMYACFQRWKHAPATAVVMIQTVYAVVLCLMVITFVYQTQFQRPLNWEIIWPCLIAVGITAGDYSQRWWKRVILRKSGILHEMPYAAPLVAAFLIAFSALKIGLMSWRLIVLLLLYALHNGYVNQLLFSSRTFHACDMGQKRFTLQLPLIHIAIQPALFGGCLSMIFWDAELAILLYLLLVVYSVNFLKTLSTNSSEYNIFHVFIFITVSLASSLYFYVYYKMDSALWPPLFSSACVAMKVLVLSLYSAGVISIPGIVSVSSIQYGVKEDTPLLEDRDRVLCLLACGAGVAVRCSWLWLDYSFLYLWVFAAADTIWACTVKYLRGRYPLTISLSILLLTGGFLICEHCGWWNFPSQISSPPQGLSLSLTMVFQFLTGLTKLAKDQSMKDYSLGTRIVLSLRNARIYGFTFVSLAISSLFIFLAPAFGADEQRVAFALGVAAIQTIALALIWFVMAFLGSTKKADEDAGNDA